MDKPLQNPFTQADYQAMKLHLQSCAVCKDTLQRAQASGFDVSAVLQEINANEQRFHGLKTNFFPGQP